MIEIQKINHDNFADVIKLKVAEGQEDFVVPVNYCIAEAYVDVISGEEGPMLFAVCNGDEVVGFAEVGLYEVEEGEFLGEKFGDKKYYDFNRFMIDARHQGKGLGKAAVLKTVEYLRTFPRGEADCISLCYASNNTVARNLYLSSGFVETGETYVEDGLDILCARLEL
ncbi:MAG: GNAT family N-acetyltransferase [Defluviitaleaceae bacterium]|nr:GNAT family N-acetyltransferase [Defluviitaleaceae bacterium]